MKIKAASLFGLTLALAVTIFAAPAQARDNYGYGNYLSSGVSNNFNGGCDGGNHHGRGPRAFLNGQYNNQGQVGIYPNTPFSGNTAYGYNSNYAYNSYANSPEFLNERAKLQQQLSYGNLSFRDREKLLNKLAKLEAKAYNQNNYNNNYNNGLLSNLRNQYLNNNLLNNSNLNNNFLNGNSLANAGYVNQVRNMLGF